MTSFGVYDDSGDGATDGDEADCADVCIQFCLTVSHVAGLASFRFLTLIVDLFDALGHGIGGRL